MKNLIFLTAFLFLSFKQEKKCNCIYKGGVEFVEFENNKFLKKSIELGNLNLIKVDFIECKNSKKKNTIKGVFYKNLIPSSIPMKTFIVDFNGNILDTLNLIQNDANFELKINRRSNSKIVFIPKNETTGTQYLTNKFRNKSLF